MIEFVAKFARNEKWYKLPIALVVVVPFVLCVSLYHSVRMLVVSFKQQTVLKLDRFGQAKRLEVEHAFKFDRESGWSGPTLLATTADEAIEARRSQMWTKKVITAPPLATSHLCLSLSPSFSLSLSLSLSLFLCQKNHFIHHKKEWYSDDDLKRIFQRSIPVMKPPVSLFALFSSLSVSQSRYPADTESVDRIMMEKMEAMMSMIHRLEGDLKSYKNKE
jgi:hypothetical protein